MWLSALSPRTRVRAAFIALGGCLLLLSAGLLYSALLRLAEQRRLRHRTVAERVFDEVEREIGSVLQHEAERPSEAYDRADTDPSNWSAFVVGYYRRDPALQLVAEPLLGAQRSARVRDAVERAGPGLALGEITRQQRNAPPGLRPAKTSGATGSPDVLRQLNRGVKVRQRRMHSFEERFAVADSGALLLAERRAPELERSEGLVIDVPLLVQTVETWVLGSQGLRDLAVLSMRSNTTSRSSTAAYTFEHRLAAPLDHYQVSLRLARLDDEDAASALYGFFALFTLAAVLGLFAICRMVEVQVAFAERRNNFVAAVTHELRTPLTSIRMYGEMLRDGMVGDEATRRDYYAIITAEGERLTRLINNVMEHARLRRGQRHAHLARGDASELVREVLEVMRPHIEREGFRAALAVGPELPSVRFDADALKQVLFNVLDNALKYGRGTEHARVEVRCERAPDGALSICVRDHGPGVPDAQLEAVFEPFFRGESELTRRQQGTGLGLALVHDLVTLMNGQVRAVNRAPGLELQISLPAA